MRVILAQAWSVLIGLVVLESIAAHGLPADLPMLSLVPPRTQVIVGVGPAEKSHRQGHFVLFTVANTIDYEDFMSLAAADPTLQIDELIFTAAAGPNPASAEHSVIVSGRLQRNRIYRASANSLRTTGLSRRGCVACGAF